MRDYPEPIPGWLSALLWTGLFATVFLVLAYLGG